MTIHDDCILMQPAIGPALAGPFERAQAADAGTVRGTTSARNRARLLPVADVHRDLRATSDELRRDLEALSALEDEKRTLPFEDPRLVEIAEQVEIIARRVLAGTIQQTSLSREAAARAPSTPTTIEDTHRPISAILADWRELERRAADTPEGSAEAAEIEVLIARLRQEYGEAFERTRSQP